MDIHAKTRWRFEVSHPELKMIRRALVAYGPKADELARKITEDLNRLKQELVLQLDAQIKLESSDNE